MDPGGCVGRMVLWIGECVFQIISRETPNISPSSMQCNLPLHRLRTIQTICVNSTRTSG